MSNVAASVYRNAAVVAAGRRTAMRPRIPSTTISIRRVIIPLSPIITSQNTHANTHARHISTHKPLHQQQESIKPKQNENDSVTSQTPQNASTSTSPHSEIPPPKESLSIVFTDIVKSTELWENTSSMTTAMRLHDTIIRSLTQSHAGYEVKQNGDGFMIAFQTAASALQFSLTIQTAMLHQDWPDDILRLQAGREVSDDDGDVVFRGLRLRVSCHWGEPVRMWNEVTSRMDYLGPMVNRAARFVQVTEGGQIVVSEEFLVELQRANGHPHPPSPSSSTKQIPFDLKGLRCPESQKALTDQNFEVRLLGDREFKGLAEPERLYFILPVGLSGRLEFWPQGRHVPGEKGNIVVGRD